MKREVIEYFQGKRNVDHIINNNGVELYLTKARSFEIEASNLGACMYAKFENETKHVLFLFNKDDEEVGRFYIGKKLQELTYDEIDNKIDNLVVFESWNPKLEKWIPCIGVKENNTIKDNTTNAVVSNTIPSKKHDDKTLFTNPMVKIKKSETINEYVKTLYPLYDYYFLSDMSLDEIMNHYIKNFYLRKYGKDKVEKILHKVSESTQLKDLFDESLKREIALNHNDFGALINEMFYFVYQSNETQALAIIAAAIAWNKQVNYSVGLKDEKAVRDDAIKVFKDYSIYEEMNCKEFDRITKKMFSNKDMESDSLNNLVIDNFMGFVINETTSDKIKNTLHEMGVQFNEYSSYSHEDEYNISFSYRLSNVDWQCELTIKNDILAFVSLCYYSSDSYIIFKGLCKELIERYGSIYNVYNKQDKKEGTEVMSFTNKDNPFIFTEIEYDSSPHLGQKNIYIRYFAC